MKSRKLLNIASSSLLIPGLVIGLSIFSSSHELGEVIKWLPVNWVIVALPQIFVVIIAILFPKIREKFVSLSLISLTVLFLLFAGITSLGANGSMLWVFYFGLSPLVLAIIAVLS